MAIKWAWAFSTDQLLADLTGTGWVHTGGGVINLADTAVLHTYSGDAVTKRSAASAGSGNNPILNTPGGTAAFDGWVACATRSEGSYWSGRSFVGVKQTGLTGIYCSPTASGTTPTIALYVDDTFKANSTATVTSAQWNWIAIKYEGSTTTFKGTVYLNGVEVIAEQSDTATTAWTTAADMFLWVSTMGFSAIGRIADFVAYDSTSDAGEVEVFCSTIEPTSDDSTVGTWTPSTGTDDFAVATPWDTATYTEDSAGTSGDLVRMGCPSISTHLGISPTVHAIVTQAVATGGADVQALFNDGSSDSVGATVTTHASNPTYAFGTVTSGLTASTTVKIGIKIP